MFIIQLTRNANHCRRKPGCLQVVFVKFTGLIVKSERFTNEEKICKVIFATAFNAIKSFLNLKFQLRLLGVTRNTRTWVRRKTADEPWTVHTDVCIRRIGELFWKQQHRATPGSKRKLIIFINIQRIRVVGAVWRLRALVVNLSSGKKCNTITV